jgi:hypothetical protein
LYAFTRYCIAFNIAAFGWKKITGLQFIVPEAIASQPMNRQPGEWLTWYYFGHSSAFGFIIAALQIGGAYLLLFRRTLLFGTLLLFSILFNLVLINIFYQMNAGALLQSVILSIGLLFILSLNYKQLVDFFVKASLHLPSLTITHSFTKNILRLSAVLLSLLFTLYLKTLVA